MYNLWAPFFVLFLFCFVFLNFRLVIWTKSQLTVCGAKNIGNICGWIAWVKSDEYILRPTMYSSL